MSETESFKRAFKKELHSMLCEDFSDSFTPGDIDVNPSHPVMMDVNYFEEKAPIILEMLKRRGITMPRGFDLRELTKETYGVKANPSTPKIPDEVYGEMRFFFGDQGFFERGSKFKPNPYKVAGKDELLRQFKSSIMHMVQLYLRVAMGKEPESFEYPSKEELAKKIGHEPNETEMKEAMASAVMSQYERYFMSIVMLSLLELSYEIKPAQIQEFMAAVGVKKEVALSSLRLSSSRKQFAKGVHELMKQVFHGQNLGEAMLKAVRQRRIK